MPVTPVNENTQRRPLGGDPTHLELTRLRGRFMPNSYFPADANGDRNNDDFKQHSYDMSLTYSNLMSSNTQKEVSMTLLLTRSEVQQALTTEDAIDLVERGFIEFGQGSVDMPQRPVISVPERNGLAIFMPALVAGMGALAIKTVTVFKGNVKRGSFEIIAKQSEFLVEFVRYVKLTVIRQ